MRDRFADWIGFLFFAILAFWTVVHMPGPAVFLGPTFAHELFMGVTFLMRERARATAPSVASRLVAYGGTFSLVLFFHAARIWQPDWIVATDITRMRVAGVLFWLLGAWLALGALWWLRYSFSIEPQARRLITSGPYALARHPIYTGYAIQYAGLWLIYPTAPLAVVILAWLALTLSRVHFEEHVLSGAFAEYAHYRRAVGALGPRLRTVPSPSPATGSHAAPSPRPSTFPSSAL